VKAHIAIIACKVDSQSFHVATIDQQRLLKQHFVGPAPDKPNEVEPPPSGAHQP